MPEREEGFEQALDEALASYGRAPARDGLEGRVLARVTHRPTRGRVMLPFGVVAVCASVAVCGLFWLQPGHPLVRKARVQEQILEKPAPVVGKIESAKTVTVPSSRLVSALANTTRRRRRRKESGEPKLAQFPTPLPMTTEERVLLRLTGSERKVLAGQLGMLSGPIETIEIRAVEIGAVEIRPLE